MLSRDNFDADAFGASDDSDSFVENDLSKMTQKLNDQRLKFEEELDEGDAYRNLDNTHDPMDWEPVHELLRDVLRDLSQLTKTRITSLFPNQYNEVMKMLRRAAVSQDVKEPNSLILMARSKMTNSSMLQRVEMDIRREMIDDKNLVVIKVNSILSNSENKLLIKFLYALGLKNVSKG